MSSEYYTLEKVAEVLGLPTAEVNRLREKNELRAFRDGSAWKFRKEEVDNMLAEKIKNRNKQQNNADDEFSLNDKTNNNAGEDDFELLVGDDFVELPDDDSQFTDDFDSAMENGFELDEELIDAPAAKIESTPKSESESKSTESKSESKSESNLSAEEKPVVQSESKSEIKFAKEKPIFNNDDALSLAKDDDLVLADDDQPTIEESKPIPIVSNVAESKKPDDDELVFGKEELSLSDDDGLTLDDDLTLDDGLTLVEEPSSSGVSFSKSEEKATSKGNEKNLSEEQLDDELLKSFSEESDLSGSSFNLTQDKQDAEESLFELEDTNTTAKSTEEKEVVFEQLSDDDDFLELINDDSSTNFINEAINGADQFELTPDSGISMGEDSESTSQLIPLDENNTFSSPFGGVDSTPFGGSSPLGSSVDGEYTPVAQTSGVLYQEVQYSPFIVGSFIAAAVFLILPCVMLLDLIANIWGWNESISINSPIINLIGGFIGITK
jgi:excisionase family DNA binding protein